MKLLHLSDLHLGKSLGDFDLIDDQRFILDRIIELIDEHEVDGLLIAGDVYDKSIPNEAAVNLLDEFLCRLSEKNIPVYMISGNHDSDDRLNFGSRLFSARGVHIAAKYAKELQKETLSKDGTEVDIWMMPFVKASHVKRYYPDEKIESYEDAVRVILSHAQIDQSRRNILIAHQFVSGKGGADPELAGSESKRTQRVGDVERIGYQVFDMFDYVALGHIHRAQQIGRETIRYSGSPLKYSLSEVRHEKSVPLITIDKDGQLSYDLLPLAPKRDLRELKGHLKDLLDPKNVTNPDDYIYAILTDEDVIDDVMSIFQKTYPRTVKIRFERSKADTSETIDISTIKESHSFEEWVTGFYQMIAGAQITEEELKILREAGREAGVLDETD